MDHPSPQQPDAQHQPTPEQQLSHQQMVINNISALLIAMEESASATAAAFEQRVAKDTFGSPTIARYKAAIPTSFIGSSENLKPWIRHVETHLP
jgi:hypothetical protein